jgi:hypothetical protein
MLQNKSLQLSSGRELYYYYVKNKYNKTNHGNVTKLFSRVVHVGEMRAEKRACCNYQSGGVGGKLCLQQCFFCRNYSLFLTISIYFWLLLLLLLVERKIAV